MFIKAKDIQQFRNVFVELSNVMTTMSKSFGPFDQHYFIQRCPMANHDKGAEWLSSTKEVLNPYFGASMLKCGEVIKEIK